MISAIPNDCPPVLRQFLEQQITRLENDIEIANQLSVRTALPTKPIKGKIYYFDNTILPTITVSGYWGYKGANTWVLLG
jgi:hypothetical protein